MAIGLVYLKHMIKPGVFLSADKANGSMRETESIKSDENEERQKSF